MRILTSSKLTTTKASVTPALTPVATDRPCVIRSCCSSPRYRLLYCSLAANLIARFGASTMIGAAIPR